MADKQQRIPGIVPKEIEEIQDKAAEVKDLQDERIDVAERENKARAELLDLMKSHKRKQYTLDDKMEVVVEASEEKAYVRRRKGVKKDKTGPKAEPKEEVA